MCHDEGVLQRIALAYLTKQGGEALKKKVLREDQDHYKRIGAKGAEIRWARYRASKAQEKKAKKGISIP